ncbi:hypothetical protein NQZ68_032618 [Dissostichus eleginoides]|nr:hypothetical protein NQZ68_032618 [Dissostichus eleginoides]
MWKVERTLRLLGEQPPWFSVPSLWARPPVSSPLSEEGSEELKEMLDSREHSVSDPPSNLVSSSDESCSSLQMKAARLFLKSLLH